MCVSEWVIVCVSVCVCERERERLQAAIANNPPELEHWHIGQRYCLPPSMKRAKGFM